MSYETILYEKQERIAYITMSTKCTSTVRGFWHKPVCIGAVWMIVRCGATSQ